METPTNDSVTKQERKEIGPMVSIVIIVLLFLAAGIYFLIKQEMARNAAPPVGQEQARLE